MIKLFLVLSVLNSWVLASEITSQTNIVEDEGCISRNLFDEINRDFYLDFNQKRLTYGKYLCESDDPVRKLILALAYLKHGKFENVVRSDDESFTNTFNYNFHYNFVRDRLKQILFMDNKCRTDSAVACVVPDEAPIAYIVETNIELLGPSELAGTLLHEARHMDGFKHVTCSHGVYTNKTGTCDQTHSEKGAYYFDSEYSALIAKYGKNISPVVKEIAANEAVFTLLNHFNIMPQINYGPHVLAQTTEGKVFAFNERLDFKSIFNIPNYTIFDRGNRHYYAYDEKAKEILELDPYRKRFLPAGQSFASNYMKNNLSDRPSIKDMFYPETEKEGFALILDDYISYQRLWNEQKKNFMSLKAFRPGSSPLRFLHYSLCKGQAGDLFFQTENGKYFQITGSSPAQENVIETNNCNTRFKNIINLGKKMIGLNNEGQLMVQENNQWLPIKQAASMKFKSLSRPSNMLNFFLTDTYKNQSSQ